MGLFRRSRKKRIWQGVALGVAGGLAGSWLMNQSQTVMSKVAKTVDGHAASHDQGQKPATVLTAEKIAESVIGAPLPQDEKKIAEPLVHYGFGALVGGLYGALAPAAPLVTLGAGSVYGALVWLLADEVAVPALGLSRGPRQTPLPKHLQALGAHLVYGLTAEGVRWAGAKLDLI